MQQNNKTTKSKPHGATHWKPPPSAVLLELF
jgi:hypothetical protein